MDGMWFWFPFLGFFNVDIFLHQLLVLQLEDAVSVLAVNVHPEEVLVLPGLSHVPEEFLPCAEFRPF